MPKQCDECHTMVNDEAPYCEACGGHNWHVPVRTWARVRQTFTAVLVLGFLAVVIWMAFNRH